MRIIGHVIAILLAALLFQLSGCADQEGGFDPIETMTLRAGDGAEVSFDFDTEQGEVQGSFERVADPDGTVTDDRKNVSATYALSLDGPVVGDLVVSIPLATDYLPDDFARVSLAPEWQDPLSGQWRHTGSLAQYDPGAQTLSFVVNIPVEDVPATDSAPRLARPLWRSYLDAAKFRVGVSQWTESVTVQIPGSAFTFTYYPSHLGKYYSIKSDSDWASTSAKATDPTIPDYIEDLDAALNEAYANLLTLSDGGTPLFTALTDAQRHVYVEDLSGDAGASPLGGPMLMSNSVIKGWEDLRGVAGHELVHVFQGNYFLQGKTGGLVHIVVGAGSWLWFIEGMANHLSARVQKLPPAAKDSLYGRNESPLYLNLGLASAHKSSYYLSAHFLDFATERSGFGIIPAVLKGDRSKRSLHVLSGALLAAPRNEGIGATFEEYARQLVRYPEKANGMNLSIVARLLSYQTNPKPPYLTGTFFRDQTTYISLTRTLPPFAAAFVEARAMNSREALLVIDSVSEKPNSVATLTWDRITSKDIELDGVLPLEDYSGKTLTVANFGKGLARSGFSQIIVNTDTSRHQPIRFAYYILAAPPVLAVDAGSVRINAAVLGNIPLDVVSEFGVFRRKDSGGFEKLGTLARGETAELTYTSSKVQATDSIVVQVVDRHGNVWPELKEGEPEAVFVGCRSFEEGVYRYGCVRMEWAGDDPEADDFIANASQNCLNASYRQYVAMAFDRDEDCRNWCSSQTAGGNTCATPGEGGSDATPAFCRGVSDDNDVCEADTCYTCSSSSEGGFVKLYDCADGCFLSSFEHMGRTLTVCDCN